MHAENGLLNYGGFATDEELDPDLHDAGGMFVTTRAGTSFFDSVTSFEIARGGRLYAVILGTYQVGGNGDLANWSAPGMIGGGIGGAMDLAAGAQHVFTTLEHCDSQRPAQAGREVRVPADHAELRGRHHHGPGAAAPAIAGPTGSRSRRSRPGSRSMRCCR